MNYVFPEGKTKALTFSYDDARAADRRLVELFNAYGLKATFHINSGRLSGERYVAREEVRALYAGHEIACHGVTHAFPDQLPDTCLVNELLNDRRALEQYADAPVTGLSYAYGAYDERVLRVCRAVGIEYARTTQATMSFFPPADFLQWHPTCHHNDAFADGGPADAFLAPASEPKRHLFYIWGHSYEFDDQNTWGEMERLCARLSGREEVWCATNREYCRYMKAVRALVFSADETTVYNPSGTAVWLACANGVRQAAPGAVLRLR